MNTPDGIFDLNSVSEEVLLEDDSPEHVKEKNMNNKRIYQPMRKLNLTIEPIGFSPPKNSKPAQQSDQESESEF